METGLASLEKVATALGLSIRQVQLLVHEGMPKAGHGQYNLEACLSWYAKRVAAGPGCARYRTARHKAMEERATRAGLRHIRRKLLALPASIAPKLEGKARAEIKAELHRAICGVLTVVAEAKDVAALVPKGTPLAVPLRQRKQRT